VPIVRGGGKAVDDELMVDVDVPITSSVCDSLVRRATTTADVPELTMIEEPRASVLPLTMYCDLELAVIVSSATTIEAKAVLCGVVEGPDNRDKPELTCKTVAPPILVVIATATEEAPLLMVLVDSTARV